MKLFASKVFQAVALAATLAFAGNAVADYPEKPVTLVSPYGPGGAADLAARTLANAASQYLGEDMIVVNKVGAAGVTGSTFVSRSRPDGYTLLLARVGSQAAVPAINPRIPYRWNDFTFLGLLEKNPFVLTVGTDSPYQSFDDLRQALSEGKSLSYASTGIGSLQHISMIMLQGELGLDSNSFTHIPYKGGGKAVAAVAGGHVDIFFQNMSGVIAGIESGQLRPLLITTDARSAQLPDTPTVAELDMPNLEQVVGWSALYGPPNLPTEIVDKWQAVLQQVSKDEQWQRQTNQLNSIPFVRDAAQTENFVRLQYDLFKAIVDRYQLAIN
ncbi:Bug family tripartite tricarboxylate transporter substrate binding protein [Marinobacterium aestuariivivens]|uniref:Bug family tripartite tricarboxylate transporter substrate binding protein n=1 Tax=Marinobacterium aestuariivivens TaxID=1698799 RepID=A0ABW2A5W2_9GAMM